MDKVIHIDTEVAIAKILDELNVPASIKGYHYLRAAIMMTVSDPQMILDGTRKLYAVIAEQYKTGIDGVDSAIRKAIVIAWDRGDVDMLNAYFGYTVQSWRGKSTPSEFIAMIADEIRLKAENDPLKTDATRILRRLGVPANIRGYSYLRSAIMMAVKEPTLIDSMAGLCKCVSSEHQINTNHVYRAMRRAINIAWDRGDEDWYVSYFGYESITLGGVAYNYRQKPTPSGFITVIANHINSKEY